MWQWIEFFSALTWRTALAATIPVGIIALLVRLVPTRPATRHTLWLMALAWFAVAPLLPRTPLDLRIPNIPFATTLTTPAAAKQLTLHDSSAGIFKPLFVEDDSDAPTPPRTDARHGESAPRLLAQAALVAGRRSQLFSPESEQSEDLEGLPKVIDEINANDASDHHVVPRDRIEAAQGGPGRGLVNALPILASESKALAEMRQRWSRWTDVAVSQVQTALVRAFTAGPVIWIAGVLALLLGQAVSCIRFLYNVRDRKPASREFQEAVEHASQRFGLRESPRVFVVNSRISPMVFFAGRWVLLLPNEFWNELDSTGRKAILYHELAHLHRKDHWVRLAECILIALYWWNPAVWWVRRRLGEESESCCDGWVTWLIPNGRRAYAQTLLQASEFIGGRGSISPAVGIGVTTVRARRFARRLEMVMTEPRRPGLTSWSIALVAVAALGAWVVTPAWSQPMAGPDTAPTAQPAAPDMPTPPAAPEADAPTLPPSGPLSGVLNMLHGGSTLVGDTLNDPDDEDADDDDDDGEDVVIAYGDHITVNDDADEDTDADDDDEADLDDRVERLERRIEELTAQLHGPAGAASPRVARVPTPPRIAMRSGESGKETRTYTVSQGKLQALLGLMSRNDVPIVVSGGGDSINVTATRSQHETFAAFVRMIDPESKIPGETRARSPRAAMAPIPPVAAVRPRSSGGSGNSFSVGTPMPEINEQVRRDIEHALRDKDRLIAEAEKLRAKAERLREKAVSATGEAKARVMQQAEEFAAQAREMGEHAREMAEHLKNENWDAHKKALQGLHGKIKNQVLERMQGRHDEGDDDDEDHDAHAEAGKNYYSKGYELHMKGKYREAIELFEQAAKESQSKPEAIYNIACGYSRLNQKDKALDYLDKAWAAGYRDAEHMKQDDDLDNIRNTARYKEIVNRGKKHRDNDDDEGDR